MLVEVGVKKLCGANEAVVVLTPSRNLRDALLQGSDFAGHVFDANRMGEDVTWLGRPSDSPGALCSWEEHMRLLVESKLFSELTAVKRFEKSVFSHNFSE